MALPTERLKTLIEAALFVAGRPLNVSELKSSVLADYPVTSRYVQLLLAEIRQDYSTRGVELKEVASGWRFQARQEYAEELSRLWSERAPRYSRAVMETLTLIAYRQPITRAEIEAIRGVAVSSQIVNTLKERGWVRSIGHKEVAGRPELLATTREFLDYFNLQSLEQLPELDPDLQPPLPPMPMAEGGSDQQSGNPDE
ncbi:SMC-Scp complex subunit ScpB [Aeromonas sobria]|uniref:SMC-Scp complex subunit ScpB n=1 Tax=Aeromonas sobria TaxID=646 RepID=A0A1S2CMK3_AERSO|nr:SMC-Scp complex subunit ScpB [Aeromonas sobria]EKP0259080.1 SMC-Scp complex subunit ScpB [Aeromonas sobria]MBS4686322.1 SMC-Scp complex subunit ScpB [Aeromonas sobria]OHY89910.1 SMC-Scp complex subunit ScpB [Aeromonas sobria]PKQ79292.1 segregation and condensation protein B [Aeromonas sobria]TNH96458.1 SMC-Scp complex subunit ScpB [Aeromonas sobria]